MTLNNNHKKTNIMKTYTYNNKNVFIAYVDDMPNVEPLAECNGKGIFLASDYNGCDTLVAADDEDAEGEDGVEICISDCNDARVDDIYTEGYVISEEYRTQLCSKEAGTALDEMIDDIKCCTRCGVISKEDFAYLDAEWDATVASYARKAEETPYGIPQCDVPTLANIIEELGYSVSE